MFCVAFCKFITEVIKVNGEEYPPNTLKEMIYCIQMFLHAKRIFWFTLDQSDDVFFDVYYVLDNEMKQCASQGLGNVKSCTSISITIKDKLWEGGKLGKYNGTVLVQTVLFLLSVNLGLRGGLEYKRLRHPGFNPQIEVVNDSDGFKCLRYTEDPSRKTYQGGVSVRPHVPKVVNVYPTMKTLISAQCSCMRNM